MKRLLFSMMLFAAIGSFAEVKSERAAFRAAVNQGNTEAVCRQGLKNQDPAIRRYALARLYWADSQAGLKAAEKALLDASPEVRKLAAHILGRNLSPERSKMLQKCADSDSDSTVRAAAKSALWPFHRQNQLLKDNPAWDFQVVMMKRDPLPPNQWKMALDPNASGHTAGWCNDELDDHAWQSVVLSGKSGLKNAGVVWYRTKFTAEAPAEFNSFEIAIPKVSGTCQAWLNSVYLGEVPAAEAVHEARFNGGAEVQPGKENTIVIRVEAPEQGGILAPVNVEWMK